MTNIKVTLCPACGGCPSLEITDAGVLIGEGDQRARLTHAQWNDLVRRVLAGELREV